MAKVKGMAATNYVGKLGPAVFYMRHGVNINRALAAEVANPQTAEQMTQRNRLTNVVRAYQANKAWMELFAYENVPEGRTLYNEFVSQNLPKSFIYLTKAEVAAYTSILAGYRFTQGTLQHISVSWGTNVLTSLNIGLESLSYDTTIAQLSQTLIDSNGDEWQEGDQLSIIVNQYRPDSLPRVVAIEITLDTSDSAELGDKLANAGIGVVLVDGKLGLTLTELAATGRPELGVLVCQSRKQGGKVLVSTQSLILNEAATTMFVEYSGPDAQRRARRSYGGVGEPFLSPGDQIPAEDTFTVNFTGAGAKYATASGTFTEGGLVTIRCNTPAGYMFEGWSGDVTGNEFDNPLTFNITQNMTISCNISQVE